MATVERVHATALAVGGKGVLIRGPSGSGKSDLALRCMTAGTSYLVPASACLVCDDQVAIGVSPAGLAVTAIDAIYGKLEVRGVGIIEVTAVRSAELVLIVDLVAPELVERLPGFDHVVLAGHGIPRLRLYPFEPSAALKLLLAVAKFDPPALTAARAIDDAQTPHPRAHDGRSCK